MLRELRNIRQHEGEGPRRWFADPDLDLILWYDREAPDRIVGFQLCYDKQAAEHALTWREPGGFTHNRVDTGEEIPSKNQSPILVQDGAIPVERIQRLFDAAGEELDADVRTFVRERLATLGA